MVENITDTKQEVNFDLLTYKDTKLLSNYLSDQGKILPRRITGLTSKQQRDLISQYKVSFIVGGVY